MCYCCSEFDLVVSVRENLKPTANDTLNKENMELINLVKKTNEVKVERDKLAGVMSITATSI